MASRGQEARALRHAVAKGSSQVSRSARETIPMRARTSASGWGQLFVVAKPAAAVANRELALHRLFHGAWVQPSQCRVGIEKNFVVALRGGCYRAGRVAP